MTRWYVGQPTKRGGVHPPRTALNRIGEPSSAMRRQENRIHDKRILANYVQLKPGVLVVWDRQPWRILSIDERPADLWGDKHEERFANEVATWERWQRGDKPERATWHERPFAIQLVPVADPKASPLHLIAPGGHSWDVLPEHYTVCVACGELPPCTHEVAEREADRQAARADVLMDIPPGHCLGCGEYVTPRQQAARFPGPNLWRPDMPEHSAVFHARQECSGEVERYRRQWEARGNTSQQPSLFADEEHTS